MELNGDQVVLYRAREPVLTASVLRGKHAEVQGRLGRLFKRGFRTHEMPYDNSNRDG